MWNSCTADLVAALTVLAKKKSWLPRGKVSRTCNCFTRIANSDEGISKSGSAGVEMEAHPTRSILDSDSAELSNHRLAAQRIGVYSKLEFERTEAAA
jgi:hypothetical protein